MLCFILNAGKQIWYPNFAVASLMTPDNGKQLTKSLYSSSSLVKVGNETLLPITYVVYGTVSTPMKPLHLCRILCVP